MTCATEYKRQEIECQDRSPREILGELSIGGYVIEPLNKRAYLFARLSNNYGLMIHITKQRRSEESLKSDRFYAFHLPNDIEIRGEPVIKREESWAGRKPTSHQRAAEYDALISKLILQEKSGKKVNDSRLVEIQVRSRSVGLPLQERER